MNDNKKQDLRQFIRSELKRPCHSSAHALVDAIMRRHGETVVAIVFYGSCLRQDPDGEPPEGIQDFYVIVDSLKRAFRGRPAAFAGSFLPPTVLYAERSWQQKRIRAKYAVVSRRQWQRGTSAKAFHPWLWARFSQPAALLYARDSTCAKEVSEGLTRAVTTMLAATLPGIEKTATPRDLWLEALRQTYKTEIRPESGDRSVSIYEADQERYEAITPLALRELSELPVKVAKDDRIEVSFSKGQRRRAGRRWKLRRLCGKPLSVLRLSKSLFTFEGGVDYALWKVERHSGVRVPLTRFERRHPLLSAPRLLWRAYRLSAVR